MAGQVYRSTFVSTLVCGLWALSACSGGGDTDASKDAAASDVDVSNNEPLDATDLIDTVDNGPSKPAPLYAEATWTGDWAPAKVLKLKQEPVRRGLLDLRGLIHAHSPYSHDACDGEPFGKDGKTLNMPCWEDFRRDFCTVGHDFVFLTDHPTHFAENEFPDVLLYDKSRGDELISFDGKPHANRISCSGRKAVIMAGAETGASMPVGLPGHIADTVKARKKLYDTQDKATFEQLKKHGAVVLYAHTEARTIEELVDLPVDGFEMYNLHANMVAKMSAALQLAAKLIDDTKKQPAADLVILPLMHEDKEYLSRWGTVFASGAKRVTTMGTDCHRNTLPLKLADGERVDSYRRMMIWFSNHLLVKPEKDGSWDSRHLKTALKGGRLYGTFDFIGYADGFDFVALQDGETFEMGDEVSVAKGATLHVRIPTLARVGAANAKLLSKKARLLRAIKGGWEEVAVSTSDIAHKIEKPGAYRAEIRVVPGHLAQHLAYMAAEAKRELVWVYSNVIYAKP